MKKISKIAIRLIMPLINNLTPSCEIISKKISESMDHRISLFERMQIKLHLFGCKLCQRYRKQLLATNTIFENHVIKDIPDQQTKLSDEARLRMKQKLSEQRDD